MFLHNNHTIISNAKIYFPTHYFNSKTERMYRARYDRANLQKAQYIKDQQL